jgi:hypothetical protein
MIKWISNFISNLKTAWLFWRYKRLHQHPQRHFNYMQHLVDNRLLTRREIWLSNSDISQSLDDVMTSYNDAHTFDNPDNPYNDEYEYSGGPIGSGVGYKIFKGVTGYGKRIGMYFHYGNFYFGIKDTGDTNYYNWIYINENGLSKHNWMIEIIGVDEV